MSDDTLRDKIADAVFEASTFGSDGNGGIIHDCRDEDATDRIIELVREALLAPEAVRAGARAIASDPAFADNTWVDDARNVLTAALGAAGLGGDDHERRAS